MAGLLCRNSQTRDTLHADGLQWNPDCFFVSLRIAGLLVSSRKLRICIARFAGCISWNSQERALSAGIQSLRRTAGCVNTSDRHFESLIQSATSHFLCNTQRNCSCLRARLLYSEREKFARRIVCQGIRQSHRGHILSCTRAVLTIFQSLHYHVMFYFLWSPDTPCGVLLPFPIRYSFVPLLHAL